MSFEILKFEGQEIRFVGTPDEPAWVASDICEVLELDTSTAVNGRPDRPSSGLDDDEKGTDIVSTPGGPQEMLIVYEPGLYSLISKSRKPQAKRFRRWIFHEVLPAIRRTGSYSIAPSQSDHPQLLPLRIRRERLEIIDLGMKLLSSLQGIDERTEIALSDLVRDIVLEDKLKKPALPGDSSSERMIYTVSDRVIDLGYKAAKRGELQRIGKAAAQIYRAKYGSEPIKREQHVDGATRLVNCYSEEHVDILDSAIRSVLEPSSDDDF